MRNIFTKEWLLGHLPLVFAVATFLVLLPAALIVDIPEVDVLSRYIPMSEAFANGDWCHAFHPRVPFLHPLVAGLLIKIFGFTPFLAVKLSSLLFFSLTFLVLIPLFQRIFPQRVVILGGCLAMLSPAVMHLAVSGLREPGKGLFFVLCVYALVVLWQERKSWKAQLLLALGCGGMMYMRDETVLFACLFLTAAFFIEIFRGRRIPFRTCFVSFPLALILLIPLLWVNHEMTGYYVPSHRFVSYAKKIQEKIAPNCEIAPAQCIGKKPAQEDGKVKKKWSASPYEPIFKEANELHSKYKEFSGRAYKLRQQPGDSENEVNRLLDEAKAANRKGIELLERVPEKDLPPWYQLMLRGMRQHEKFGYHIPSVSKENVVNAESGESKAKKVDGVWDMVGDVLESFALIFFLPALFGIGLRIYRREFRAEELIVLLCVSLQSVLIAAQKAIAEHNFEFPPRYGFPVSILFVGWAAVAVFFVYDLLNKYVFERYPGVMLWRKRFLVLVCVCVGIGLYCGGLNAEIREVTSTSKRTEFRLTRLFGKAIREDYKGPATFDGEDFEIDVYTAGKRPKIYIPLNTLTRLSHFAGGEALRTVWYGENEQDTQLQINRFDEVSYRNFTAGIPIDYYVFCVEPEFELPEFEHFETLKVEVANGKKYILLKNTNGGNGF